MVGGCVLLKFVVTTSFGKRTDNKSLGLSFKFNIIPTPFHSHCHSTIQHIPYTFSWLKHDWYPQILKVADGYSQ